MKRDHYLCPLLGGDSASGDNTEERWVVDRDEDYNLIGSTVGASVGDRAGKWAPLANDEELMHMPVLDVDLQCWLKPSETPGHFHLYIDKLMPWSDYEQLIKVLAKVGIIEPGYAKVSLERHATFVAPFPWKEAANDQAQGA